MATLNIPYSFTNGTIASAIEVNADFTAIKSFVESSLVHADGTVKAGTAAIADGAVTTPKLATATQNFLVPVGSIVMFGGSVAPTGWLLCNGTSTSGYPLLAAIVGANTPNMEGRFPIGDNSSLTLLGTGGSTTISESNLPAHSHSVNINTNTTGSHQHASTATGYKPGYWDWKPTNSGTTISNWGYNITTDGAGDHAHNVNGNTGNTGGGSAYYQPFLVVNYIIKHD